MDKLVIGQFEGPLDLLLHLIKKSKLEIFDIDICDITSKYIEYINQMKELNLDITSEYLVMAAELIEIKSKKLLPKKNNEEEDEEYIDYEEELKKRLLEYEKYKEATENFKTLEIKRSNYYTKAPELIKIYSDEKILNDGTVGLFDLLDAFKNLLERQNHNKPLSTKITKKELSVKERIVKIRNVIKEKGKVKFVDLFDELTKSYVVVTFLSILQMAKNNEIVLTQENNFSDIYVEGVEAI